MAVSRTPIPAGVTPMMPITPAACTVPASSHTSRAWIGTSAAVKATNATVLASEKAP